MNERTDVRTREDGEPGVVALGGRPLSESGVFGEGFGDGAWRAWIERGGKGSHQLRFTQMMVLSGNVPT